MTEYFIRLFVLLPLIGGLAWGSLWLWRRVQIGLPVTANRERPARVIDVLPMGTGSKIAVLEFQDQQLLVAVTRNQISLLSSGAKDGFDG
jgi:flagellar protein FliO/FliZ